MFIRNLRTSVQDTEMSCAITMARTLERRERQRVSSLAQARQRLANKLRIGRGTFENLVRGRVKRIDAVIRDRLHSLLARELEAEIARLTHELDTLRQAGARPDSEHFSEVETYLLRARSLLAGPPSPQQGDAPGISETDWS